MKTITKKYKVYNFNELNEAAKEKAIENNRDINVDYEWFDGEEDYFKEDMDKLGFQVDKIYFTGFYSQGDGACFEGQIKVYDYLKYNKKLSKFKNLGKTAKEEDLTVTIKHSGHYCHENSMDFEDDSYYLSKELTEKQIKELDQVIEEIKTLSKQQAIKLYANLEKQYEYLTSSKAIIETIELNDYTFLEDGTQFFE